MGGQREDGRSDGKFSFIQIFIVLMSCMSISVQVHIEQNIPESILCMCTHWPDSDSEINIKVALPYLKSTELW